SFFNRYTHTRALHSFPTRRSSDLPSVLGSAAISFKPSLFDRLANAQGWRSPKLDPARPEAGVKAWRRRKWMSAPWLVLVIFPARSEEHTSELQSLRHLVCRLLLEK